MPTNVYPNATRDELVGMLESLQRRGTTGEVSFATIPGGGQVQRSVQGAPSVKAARMEVLYALFKLVPNEFDNPYVQRIRKTMPYYV